MKKALAFIRGVDEFQIDLFKLFLHEQSDCGPFSEGWVAMKTAQWLRSSSKLAHLDLEILPPEDTGLNRFILMIGKRMFSNRCYSVSDLKSYWPKEVFDALQGVVPFVFQQGEL